MIFTSIDALLPEVKEAYLRGAALLKAAGVGFAVIETKRDYLVQVAYYMQGRAPLDEVNEARKMATLPTITEARNTKCTETLRSMHRQCRAFDCVPVIDGKVRWDAPREVWEKIGEAFKSVGFVWGGDWGKTAAKLGWDCPHFEMRGK